MSERPSARRRSVKHTQSAGRRGHDFLYDDVRNQAVGSLLVVNPAWLRVSMNPSTGSGATCYGDSGGPNFLGTTTTLAVTRSEVERSPVCMTLPEGKFLG